MNSIPWGQLGVEAQKKYTGDGIATLPTEYGAKLKAVMQDLEGDVTNEGLWLTSSADEDAGKTTRFRVIATEISRRGSKNHVVHLPATGQVRASNDGAAFIRPGLIEEYTVSSEGVRQDFVVLQKPVGSGTLSVQLEVAGARAEASAYGVKLIVSNSGREIAYSRLKVTDAAGSELIARLQVDAANRLSVVVDDDKAVYPIRIDPTFSDVDWISMGGIVGTGGPNGFVYAAVMDQSGSLYIGGDFTIAGSVLAKNIAKWNGSMWSALGSGMNQPVDTLVIYSGNLHAGGRFSTAGGVSARGIAKWNGSIWSAVGTGINGSVMELVVKGSDLYAGGNFSSILGGAGNRIAKWNGTAWSALGSGMNGEVWALAVVGNDLFAGGSFTTAGGISASRIAKWDGSSWSALGAGTDNTVIALAVSGSDLYAAGSFTTAGGVAANRVAKWNGTAWSALGSGMNDSVTVLAAGGTDLYAGGLFTTAGGVTVNYVAKWNGSAWSALGSGTSNYVYVLLVSGADLYVGGTFGSANGVLVNRIAKWNGSAWSAVGPGTSSYINAMAVSGADLYVGGEFTIVAGVTARYIAKWNGSTWSALGSGTNGFVFALAASGSDLFAGGNFTTAGGVSANRIAKWNGSSWSALGAGMNSSVSALAVSGSDLFAGGSFTTAGGVSANRIAKWNGSSWSALGAGVDNAVGALAVAGSDLYAGGDFTTAGGISASRIAKWDGSSWSALGAGMDTTVSALAVAGNDLYAGGSFTTAGGIGASKIAKWNGSTWSALGTGMDGWVWCLAVSASDLYAGGSFTTAGGGSASRVARWDGTTWNAMGSGMDNSVNTLVMSGSNLYAGGDFITAGGKVSAYLAQATNLNPEIVASGNSVNIADGDSSPGSADHTDFGSTAVAGGTVLRTFTIQNTGTTSLTLGTVTVSGLHAADFAVTLPPSSPVINSGTTTFQVTFNPSELGVRSATLSFSNNDTDENPFDFNIQGTGTNSVPTNIVLTPSSIAENNALNAVVGILSATDADISDVYTFTLVTGAGSTDNASFTITGSSLNINGSANYEAKSSYSLRVRADDGNGGLFEKALTVSISNVNEAPSNIALSASSIAENNAANATVGTLSATDVDAGDTRTYTLATGAGDYDNASFTIAGTSLKLTHSANFETKSSYEVRVRVTDAGALFFEKPFAITIRNANEMPSFIKGSAQTHPIRTTGAQNIPDWATAINDGDSTVSQALSFNSSVISGGSIFATPPSVSSDGAISYTTNGSAGTAVVSVTLTDDASINANPALTTTAQTFTIRVEGPGGLDSLDANIVGDRVLAMAMQPDGKMLLGGSFTSVLGVPRANIARLNVDGTLDMGFDPKTDGVVYAVAVQPDGKVLVGGSFGTLQPNGAVSATVRQHLARVHADGTLDAAFDPKADSHVRSILPQPDGKVLVAGDFTSMQPNGAASATPRAYVARLLADGSLDAGFTPNANDVVYALALQYDQKILLGGDFTTLQGTGAASFTNRRYIARLNADGTLDASFDPKANGTVFALAEQSDGKLLMGGAFTTLQPNGAPSSVTRNYIARVNATGTLDTGFNPSANGSVFSLARQANGRLLLGGAFTGLQPNGAAVATVRNYLARLNSDGTLDASFDPNANGLVYGIALQDDGRVLVGGELTTLQPNAAPVASARTLFARLVNDTASRVLAAPDFTQVTWTHGGAAPVVNGVTFDLSTNGGSSWAQIGVGTRISSTVNWQLAGLSLPSSGMLRARGRAVSGIYNGSSSLFEQVESFVVAVPDIVLEEPVGTELLNGTGMANFGPVAFDGSSSEKQFTIRNAGNAPLSLAGVTLSGAQAGSFVVNTTGMASVLDPMSATTFTVTFTPGELGSQGASLLVASNDQDEPGYGVTLAGTGVTSLQGWRQLHFGTTSGSGNAADNADPDGDGLGNFIEWACALNPTTNSTLPTPVVLSGAEIEYFYMRSVAAVNAGTVFEVQWSDSLPGTAWSTTNVTQTILSTNGTTQQVKATLPAGSSEQRFVRLRVTSGP
ncbi:MAG: choice-of-anchor D domain-containing protein [Verrucomicrobiaceae bacterium]|nr:choice-of-anchor D domain-containing protein [Verrucomicrobiaceae bacterium]